MSDTPVTLDGPSGPSREGSVAPSTPKKPWRPPLVITSAFTLSDTEKPTFGHDGDGAANTIDFGPS